MTTHFDSEAIVLTGCGWVTPFAQGSLTEVLQAGSKYSPQPDAGCGFWVVPDSILDAYPKLSNELKRDKHSWLLAVAVEHALETAGLELARFAPERVGLAIGCALAGQLGMINFASEVKGQSPRFVSPIHFPQTVGNYPAGALARGFGLRGPNLTLSSGTASGLDAIDAGVRMLSSGMADVALAGGGDCLSKELATAFGDPDTPLSEGACVFVLERADTAALRGAKVIATVTHTNHEPSTDAVNTVSGNMIVSTAGCCTVGGVFAEHWTGFSFGAAAAAAVAAAIGAAQGLYVPLVSATDPTSVTAGVLSSASGKKSGEHLKAEIHAETGDGHRSVLGLSIPV